MRLAKSFMISVLALLVISSNQRAQCYRILALFPPFSTGRIRSGLYGHKPQRNASHFYEQRCHGFHVELSIRFRGTNGSRRWSHGLLAARPSEAAGDTERSAHEPTLRSRYSRAPCYLAMGRHLSLPMVGVSALRDCLSESVGSPQSTAFVPNGFSDYSQGINFWERLVNTVERAVYSMQLNYYTECQNEFVRKHVDPAIPDVLQLYGDFALLLVNSHHSMQRIGALAPAVVEVAGLHLNDDAGKLDSELENWFNRSESGCMYFTTDTIVKIESFPRDKLDALYETFRRIAPVRVLMKITNEKELPPGLPENFKIRPWNSQLRVLRHKNVKAFMSHGGIFGIQEAIYSAVPLIGIPLFGDQQANVNTFARTKVLYPLSFSDITADNVERAIRTILEDPSYSDGMEKLRTLFLDRPLKPLDTAIFWIEYVARHGDVMRSPGLHIGWWQRELLDVYVFLVSSCALVLYTSLVLFVRKPMYYRHYLGQGERLGRFVSVTTTNDRNAKKIN